MEIAYLAVVFLAIVVLLAVKRPLYQAILGGIAATVLLYRIPLIKAAQFLVMPFIKWESFAVLLSFYLITFLQRILEARQQISLAQENLNRLFNNRRVNTAGAPLFIGLLPSAAAMVLCSDIVKQSTDGYLDAKEQAVVASWFRHIPECALPTYTAVLLMVSLSGVQLSAFLPAMVVPALTLAALGYAFYLRKVPRDTGVEKSSTGGRDVLGLFQHLWSLLLILALIIGAGLHVVYAVAVSIVASFLVYRISAAELKTMVRTSFEKRILLNTYLVLALKEFIAYVGVLELLPEAMSVLPLPPHLVFAALFFAATLVSGSTAAIALGVPLAVATLPGGVPLMAYLMCVTHAASQLSPTHVCLAVASEYFHVSLGDLVRKTLPLSLLFVALMTGYYQLLLALYPVL